MVQFFKKNLALLHGLPLYINYTQMSSLVVTDLDLVACPFPAVAVSAVCAT